MNHYVISLTPQNPYPDFALPACARTAAAERLAGVRRYHGDDDDVDFFPAWNEERWEAEIDEARGADLDLPDMSTIRLKKDDA